MVVLIAGHTGLVGSAIFEFLEKQGEDVIGVNRSVIDLLHREQTIEFVSDIRPDVVIDAAAIVGGIIANNSYPVDFLSMNLQIQTNIMDASHAAGVDRFVFMGSSCIYPRDCPQPIKEEYLMTGPLETTNSAYAIAKIAGMELVKSYRKQFGHRWISIMPTNMYGPRDNFNLKDGHVLPALINKFVTAAREGSEKVTLWGTGTPKREFLHAWDLAEATMFLIENYDADSHINVGSGQDLTISELASLVARISGFSGEIEWDTTKPDGTPRKLLDVSRIKAMGWTPKVALEKGIEATVNWFRANESKVRA